MEEYFFKKPLQQRGDLNQKLHNFNKEIKCCSLRKVRWRKTGRKPTLPCVKGELVLYEVRPAPPQGQDPGLGLGHGGGAGPGREARHSLDDGAHGGEEEFRQEEAVQRAWFLLLCVFSEQWRGGGQSGGAGQLGGQEGEVQEGPE